MRSGSAQDPRQIDSRLRDKYDVRGPRYTSYPPATHFCEMSASQVLDPIRQRNGMKTDPGLSLYFHIPFCRNRCLFCGCHSLIKSGQVVEDYLNAMLKEMTLAAQVLDPERPVYQVALGGGTPNFLMPSQIRQLGTEIASIWSLQPKAEISVEIDPRTSNQEKLKAFLEHGFNRFSLGVQDLDPTVLERVRRGQDDMQVEEVVDFLRNQGIKSINFDLIYGLPGQSVQSVVDTAKKVCRFRPERIALYSYAHVPWIRPHQKALEKFELPSAELKAALFLSMMDVFLPAGYLAIGMDHFALPKDPLAIAAQKHTLRRNFMGYTTGRGLDLAAFGVSAISSVGAAYYQNEKQIEDYQKSLNEGQLPIVRGFLLSKEDRLRRELIMELFCNFYVDLDSLSDAFEMDVAAYLKSDFERLKDMHKDGLVDWSSHSIKVTEVGRFFIRNICMTFDRYLERDLQKRMYSRTI